MEDQGSPPRKWFGSWSREGEPIKLLTRYSGEAQAEETNTTLIQASSLPSLEPSSSYLDFHHVVLPCLPAHANSALHPPCQLGNWHFYAIFMPEAEGSAAEDNRLLRNVLLCPPLPC